ncbi:hypothetical protein HDU87_003408 [Geranomyces variabilis]|uniref:Uncharacterized protein n=1 Tax=Geranomyces variabilis TaxID=109894 RepID=A0AAD5TJY6_9FUNG|nr:hypothetical protein HDU87_003408 [Geranomyces variabilis]
MDSRDFPALFATLIAKHPEKSWTDFVHGWRQESDALESEPQLTKLEQKRWSRLHHLLSRLVRLELRATEAEKRLLEKALDVHEVQSKTNGLQSETTRDLVNHIIKRKPRSVDATEKQPDSAGQAEDVGIEPGSDSPSGADSDSDGTATPREVNPPPPDAEPLPGLLNALRGEATPLPSDQHIAGVNCSLLLRKVFADLEIDRQTEEELTPAKAPIRAVTRQLGLLLDRFMPQEYAAHISIDEYEALYKNCAGSDTLWDAMAKPVASDVAAAVAAAHTGIFANIKTLATVGVNVPGIIHEIYPRLAIAKPYLKNSSEPSHTAKYALPFFERLIPNRLWSVELDAKQVERKRLDISIKAGKRTCRRSSLEI